MDFIFASELDQDPKLRADMEAAAKRMEGHVLDRLSKKTAARQRLGRLEGVYSFSALVSVAVSSKRARLADGGGDGVGAAGAVEGRKF